MVNPARHADFVNKWTHPDQLGRLKTLPLHPRLVGSVRENLLRLRTAPQDEVLIGNARASLADAMAGHFVSSLFGPILRNPKLRPFEERHEVRVYDASRLNQPLDPENFDNGSAPSFKPRNSNGAPAEAIPVIDGLEGSHTWEVRIGGGAKHHWSTAEVLFKRFQEARFGNTSRMLITSHRGIDIHIRVFDPEAARAIGKTRNWQPALYSEFAPSHVYPILSAEDRWAVSYLDRLATVDGNLDTHPFATILHDYGEAEAFYAQPANLRRLSHAILTGACNVFPDYVENNGGTLAIRAFRETGGVKSANNQFESILKFIFNLIEDETKPLDRLAVEMKQFVYSVMNLKDEKDFAEFGVFFTNLAKLPEIIDQEFQNRKNNTRIKLARAIHLRGFREYMGMA